MCEGDKKTEKTMKLHKKFSQRIAKEVMWWGRQKPEDGKRLHRILTRHDCFSTRMQVDSSEY